LGCRPHRLPGRLFPMFTGIIEGLGTISGLRASGQGTRLTVEADFALDGTRIGDSLSVSGACLTVVSLEGRRFEADVSPETLARTTFGRARIGDRVNLERALRLSDRIDGHLVSGHVDGTGTIAARNRQGNSVVIGVRIDKALSRTMIEKGSVAVDGISLTINVCEPERFQVSIIPHTARMSTVGFKTVGQEVNIETDLIGKYVERFTLRASGRAPGDRRREIDMAFLADTGFLSGKH
jgi:riboflavin synthase